MQTTTVSLGFLKSVSRFLAQHITETPQEAHDKGSIASSIKAIADMHVELAPRWSAGLQPLYDLADSTGRPIAGIDIEGTGTDTQTDKIVELVVVRIEPSSRQTSTQRWLIHPSRPIPPSATAVHGYSDEDVSGSPSFEIVAAQIAETLAGCTIVGFNSNHYDVPLLMTELGRCGIQWPTPGTLLLDSSVIFRRKERRRLSDAVKTYCYYDGETAHQAEADAHQALAVLAAQLERFPELGAMNAEELDFYCNNEAKRVDFSGKLATNEAGEIAFTFGKHKGTPVLMERGYASWMLKGDFPEDTKAALRHILG